MKKIIVLLGISLSLFLSANAATYNWTWSVSNLYAYNSTSSKIGDGTIINLYAVGMGESGADLLLDTYTFKASDTLGKIDPNDPDAFFTTSTFILDTDYSFYLTYENEGKMFTSAAKSGFYATEATAGTNIGFNSLKTQTQNVANWSSGEAVPEPTSVLLMMIGIAGLGLRRKQK